MTKKKDPSKLLEKGRPSAYKPEYCQQMIDYFSRPAIQYVEGKPIAGHFPTLAGYASKLGVCRDTLHEWSRVHPDFSDAYKQAKQLQEDNLVQGTLSGAYQPTFAIFTAKNVLGWRDKVDLEHSGPNGGPQQHEVNANVTVTAEEAYLRLIGK